MKLTFEVTVSTPDFSISKDVPDTTVELFFQNLREEFINTNLVPRLQIYVDRWLAANTNLANGKYSSVEIDKFSLKM